jgi:cystathionine beta-lyase/cystathionine gamma-synthase
MTSRISLAKQAVHDKFTSQIQTVEAQLDTLKARAEAAKTDLELRAIAELLVQKPTLKHVHELTKVADDHWEHAKRQLEARLSDFEKAVKSIESKFKDN